MITEINFDGIIGPSHNYAALSLGNLASTAHARATSYPRAAALQGLAKMRTLSDLGLPQGFLLPCSWGQNDLLEQLERMRCSKLGLQKRTKKERWNVLICIKK